MGCDIHVMLEHRTRNKAQSWDSLGFNAINPGRDYEKFSRLAGVRGDGDGYAYVEPRGMPSDPSFGTQFEHWLFISEKPGNGERYVKPADAERWVLQGISTYRDDKKWVSDPDQHTHTWLTLAEWLAAVDDGASTWSLDWKALTAAAKSYEDNGHEVRFVFWFDN